MSPSPVTRFEAFTVEHFALIAGFLVVCVRSPRWDGPTAAPPARCGSAAPTRC